MIKFLKVFCSIFTFIFFMCLFFTPFLYGGVIKDYIPCFWLAFMFFILALVSLYGYKILVDVEADNKEWMDLGKKKRQRAVTRKALR